MPDEHRTPAPSDVEFDAHLSGRWGTLAFAGPGRVRLTSDAIVVDDGRAAPLHVPVEELTGAEWRTGAITIHGAPGTVTMEARDRTDGAWAALVALACPVPEVARGHRRLGSRRGGPPDAQARFLAPLMQARRDLQAEQVLDRRVGAVKGSLIRDRLREVIGHLAAEAHPASAPDRRGLAAELEEAMAPLYASLEELDAAAKAFVSANDATRFEAWRAWVGALSRVFSRADLAWAEASGLMPARAAR